MADQFAVCAIVFSFSQLNCPTPDAQVAKTLPVIRQRCGTILEVSHQSGELITGLKLIDQGLEKVLGITIKFLYQILWHTSLLGLSLFCPPAGTGHADGIAMAPHKFLNHTLYLLT